MGWYSHLLKNFPQFIVIHTVKGFGLVNKAEIDVFLERSCFFNDHEIFIAKFRLKFKKVGKTTRPFMYDLNQSPYNYTVEVTNRFKGFSLIDRVPEELWMEVCDIVGGSVQDHPQEK